MNEPRSANNEGIRSGLQPLISARVDDTPVFDSDGRKLGSVYSFHIDRANGRVEYAVLSTGGLLGLGQSYHPIPFRLLQVNQQKGGYTVVADKEMLNGGPSYRPDNAPQWDADYARRIASYYEAVEPRPTS
jgi:sporulation protein YlmC with PRC-barrel domain